MKLENVFFTIEMATGSFMGMSTMTDLCRTARQFCWISIKQKRYCKSSKKPLARMDRRHHNYIGDETF